MNILILNGIAEIQFGKMKMNNLGSIKNNLKEMMEIMKNNLNKI